MGGCAKPKPDVAGLFSDGLPIVSDDPKWHGVGLDTVRVLDENLRGRLKIEYAGAQFVKDGRLMAYAVAHNLEDRPLLIEARGNFFDRMQKPLEEGETWVRVVLGPKAFTPFRVMSQAKREPSYFVIDVREGKGEK